jgi:hypothetical protein
MPNIVIVNVSQLVAPTPNKLQQTGAFVSQGGTINAPGTISLLTQLSDLTPIINGAHALSGITWASSVATVTTGAPHGFTIADTLLITIVGASPTGYNGTYTATITGASTFTYPLIVNPGSPDSVGSYTVEDVAELNAMATTFFAQGSSQSVYVLELGPGNAADGVTYLTNWITNTPQFFYLYLVPRAWASASTYWTMVANFESPTSKTYFFTTMTASNYTNFTALMKSVVGLIEAPGIPTTEFSLAAPFWVVLHQLPSTTNKVTPFAYSFLFGVTPYPTMSNSALLATWALANVNVVGTGAEGGISGAILSYGTTMDGNDFTYWYSVDWVQINVDLNVSNAIINGSNNPVNPLYYNQAGINVLESVIASTMNSAVTFGLALFPSIQVSLDGPILSQALFNNTYAGFTIVNAVPFITYSVENPSDYKIGRYAGFSVTYTPARGFRQIVFNLVVSQFVIP